MIWGILDEEARNTGTEFLCIVYVASEQIMKNRDVLWAGNPLSQSITHSDFAQGTTNLILGRTNETSKNVFSFSSLLHAVRNYFMLVVAARTNPGQKCDLR